MTGLKFVDLFAGLGGFHLAMAHLGHRCVFASELDDDLRQLYLTNFPGMIGKVYGDIRESKVHVPDHDFLCAGFPCQPFSKSGGQLGTKDETRGTLFHEILEILDRKRPRFVLLENVGNFGRHDDGRTWQIVKDQLIRLGYDVAGTEHLTPAAKRDWRDIGLPSEKETGNRASAEFRSSGGHGLISPHHFGFPHHRERFYVFATLGTFSNYPFPTVIDRAPTTLDDIVQSAEELSPEDQQETRLTQQQRSCIDHWNCLVKSLPPDMEPPSFPLWGDELGAKYPYKKKSPWGTSAALLGQSFNPPFPKYTRKEKMIAQLPSYAREKADAFRHWKTRFIEQNRAWWNAAISCITPDWERNLRMFPPSLRKLEWNIKGEDRDLWKHVLQFRPSGLRVKRYSSSPALVAMTSTQIPILGPQRRFLTRVEGKRLQGFPDEHALPTSRDRAFKALGNAVHVGVIERLAFSLVECADRVPCRRCISAPELVYAR